MASLPERIRELFRKWSNPETYNSIANLRGWYAAQRDIYFSNQPGGPRPETPRYREIYDDRARKREAAGQQIDDIQRLLSELLAELAEIDNYIWSHHLTPTELPLCLPDDGPTPVESVAMADQMRRVVCEVMKSSPVITPSPPPPAQRKPKVDKISLAIMMLMKRPDLENIQIAAEVGLAPETLSRNKLFIAARAAVRDAGKTSMRRARDRFSAADEDEDEDE